MRTLALAFTLVLAASGVSAQPDWRPVPQGTYFSVEALGSGVTFDFRPTSDGVEVYELDQRLAVALVSGQIPLSPRFLLTASLPAGFYDASTNAPAEFQLATPRQAGIGNLYVGATTALAPEASVEVGVWLPTSTDGQQSSTGNTFAVAIAGTTTDYEHREAYAKDFLSARIVLRGGLPVSEALRVRAVASPVLGYNTGRVASGSDEARTNLALAGGAFVDGLLGPVTLTAGTTARYEPSNGSLFAFDELSLSVLGAVAVDNLPVRPGLLVRVPMVGDGGLSDVILGASLGLPLR